MTDYQPGTWVTEFKSSNVARFRWTAGEGFDKGTLSVAFWNDGSLATYTYDNVSRSHFEDLCEEAKTCHKDGSVGRYVNRTIKGNHPVEKVGTFETDETPDTIVV